ncbi:MAG: hypothetical protein WKF83_11810 [Nocardioidaceae bacterium]
MPVWRGDDAADARGGATGRPAATLRSPASIVVPQFRSIHLVVDGGADASGDGVLVLAGGHLDGDAASGGAPGVDRDHAGNAVGCGLCEAPRRW